MKAAVFTINTRAYEQKKSSKTGAALKTTLEQIGFEVKEGVLPEDKIVVAAVMKQLADSEAVQLIITTGAVGYLKKDCAPDALMEVADRLLPGIPEAIRAYNIRYTKKVILNRGTAGIRNKTIIVNLHEGQKSARESLEYIIMELVQALETMNA